MEEVVIALGSNLGDRLQMIRNAGIFLDSLSESAVERASIWESEPVGGAKYTFLNTAAKITTRLTPLELLKELKDFEQLSGRDANPTRWGPRILDMDIIRYGDLICKEASLTIPHPEYQNRLFVLLPMLEIDAGWIDPELRLPLDRFIKDAPKMELQKTDDRW
jgi:2-amino-4-hydroxy-6-hydroxymethyldihydropteridine diphosphokinase